MNKIAIGLITLVVIIFVAVFVLHVGAANYELVSFKWGAGTTMYDYTAKALLIFSPTTGAFAGPITAKIGDPTPGVLKTAAITYKKKGVTQPVFTWVENSNTVVVLP